MALLVVKRNRCVLASHIRNERVAQRNRARLSRVGNCVDKLIDIADDHIARRAYRKQLGFIGFIGWALRRDRLVIVQPIDVIAEDSLILPCLQAVVFASLGSVSTLRAVAFSARPFG